MRYKKSVSKETFVALFAIIGVFVVIGRVMGLGNMFNTLMNTAHDLLINTCFFIMAISVVTGALSNLFAEFGVIDLLNKIISPLMRPIYGLPGAASLGVVTTFISDNAAVLSLTKNEKIKGFFKEYQIPLLCNLGTSFGMGLILVTYMLGMPINGALQASLTGVLGAVIGSIVSVSLMRRSTIKFYGVSKEEARLDRSIKSYRKQENQMREIRGSALERVLNAMLEGGKTGVDLGFAIVPGVVFICTFVMMLTFGPGETGFTGDAYQGIALLPKFGELIQPITNLLFGFKDPSAIAFPITSLGATGAAMALVPSMIASGAAGLNEIAVFTAMGMCWSGYLSTHISMMDALDKREFIKSALLSHTIGGLCAGVAAHYLWMLFSLI
ncbi:MAG: hypothetical protein J6C76_01830 [Oscillospiraceae bacterium]|nr:hypothetical protein [Oscillospiraceae bacterium]MBP1570617.1 hypothetical protein [Oscillospiraceae bacterium]